ncbi:uncharacterized protein LOC115329276 [Ixodes scapularis]|uniref:uncharacterized protein LOC115329276 n=1 Tax=Ixodes scapularis TaxID=6945 RepID=UPI001A9F1991|nr:uncharacterized protein LOC115329276 [Ixodes scapularis]
MKQLVKLESTLNNAAVRRQFTTDDLKEALGVRALDFDLARFSAQLLILPALLCSLDSLTIDTILRTLQAKSEEIRELLNQVVKYTKLLHSVPASVASGERSFSALRRIRTYLRSLMSQGRLIHLLILHIQKERTAELNLDDIIKKFFFRTAERTATFGLP